MSQVLFQVHDDLEVANKTDELSAARLKKGVNSEESQEFVWQVEK